jgi:flagellar motor switch protein FliN/FliY
VTSDEALQRLAERTAEACESVFASLGVEVARGAAIVVPEAVSPLHGIPAPVVATSVSYVDGVTGGNVFVLSRLGARKLATVMMGGDPATVEDGDLDELERSAVGEAMNQMMAAAAAATSAVLGEEIDIAPPETRLFSTAAEAEAAYEATTPFATNVAFTLLGESCRLVQLIPNAFVVRMTQAFVDLDETSLASDTPATPAFDADALRDVDLRITVELGRTLLSVGRAVGLEPGAVVELDRDVDDPIDLLVNGRRFAVGRLVLTEDGEWAVRVEEVFETASPHVTARRR